MTGGAAHRREELEGPADPATGASSWPESAARDAVLALAGDAPLEDMVNIRQLRRKRTYGRAGAVVELSVDDVEVIAAGRVIERFAELEVELREGDEATLEPLVDLLAEVEELLPVDTSKLERAMEALERESASPDDDELVVLADGAGPAGESTAASPGTAHGDGSGTGGSAAQGVSGATSSTGEATSDAEAAGTDAEPVAPEPRIIVPKSPGVLPDDHLAEAGRKVLRFHLARMVAREEGTRTGKDAEELHAMRVATRRQRAAWRVFGDAFDPRRTERHRRRLKLVAADLGAVRDLDVLIDAGESYRETPVGVGGTSVRSAPGRVAHPPRRRPRRAHQGARQQPPSQVGG